MRQAADDLGHALMVAGATHPAINDLDSPSGGDAAVPPRRRAAGRTYFT
jgi:hypothetical protein